MGGLADACQKAIGLELVIHTKAKTDEGGDQMESMLQAIKNSNENPAIVGILAKVQCHTMR